MSISEESRDDQSSPVAAAHKARPRSPFRVSRLMLKELRETLRDRRTLITLILMPLLVYPALSLVFKTFLLSNLEGFTEADPVSLRIVFDGDGSDEEVWLLKERFTQVANTALREAEVKGTESSIVADAANGTSSDQDLIEKPARNLFAGLQPFGEHKWFPIANGILRFH